MRSSVTKFVGMIADPAVKWMAGIERCRAPAVTCYYYPQIVPPLKRSPKGTKTSARAQSLSAGLPPGAQPVKINVKPQAGDKPGEVKIDMKDVKLPRPPAVPTKRKH